MDQTFPRTFPGKFNGSVSKMLPLGNTLIAMGQFSEIQGPAGYGKMPAVNIAWLTGRNGEWPCWETTKSPINLARISDALFTAEGLLVAGIGGFRLLNIAMGLPLPEVLPAPFVLESEVLRRFSAALDQNNGSCRKAISAPTDAANQLLVKGLARRLSCNTGSEGVLSLRAPNDKRPFVNPEIFRSYQYEVRRLCAHRGRIVAGVAKSFQNYGFAYQSAEAGGPALLDAFVEKAFANTDEPKAESIVFVWNPLEESFEVLGNGLPGVIRDFVSTNEAQPKLFALVAKKYGGLYELDEETNKWIRHDPFRESTDECDGGTSAYGMIACGSFLLIYGKGFEDSNEMPCAAYIYDPISKRTLGFPLIGRWGGGISALCASSERIFFGGKDIALPTGENARRGCLAPRTSGRNDLTECASIRVDGSATGVTLPKEVYRVEEFAEMTEAVGSQRHLVLAGATKYRQIPLAVVTTETQLYALPL